MIVAIFEVWKRARRPVALSFILKEPKEDAVKGTRKKQPCVCTLYTVNTVTTCTQRP